MTNDPSPTPVLTILEEPRLEFRHRQAMEDPRDGLSLFGPCDVDEPSHPKSLAYAVLGPEEGIALFSGWSEAMNLPHVEAPKGRVHLWPPFPGFEAAFATTWHPKAAWTHVVDRAALLEASRHVDPNQRAFDLVNLYLKGFDSAMKIDDPLAVAVCIVPEEVYLNCRPRSRVANSVGERVSAVERGQRVMGQTSLFNSYDPVQYQLSVDFRRQLKARGMRYNLPIQILRESVLRLNDEKTWGERNLTPLSNRMWNIATALYYKGGGRPWRLASAREGVCYIGIAFRQADKGAYGPRTACCAAQMFLNSGDGIVFLGEYGPWYSPEKKMFRLTQAAARDLLKGALDTYEQLHGKPLTEVFLHSRSDISAEEFAGYQEACPDGVRLTGVRVRINRSGPRLYREGAMPILRGTFWRMSDRGGYLYATGFKPRLRTYDGWETPAPLQIDVQHGDADITEVARDILGLTKLNYNACTLGDAQPVTVKFSDAVGEILVSNPTITERRPQFKFYI